MQKNKYLDDIAMQVSTGLEAFPDILFVTLFGSAVKERLVTSSDIDLGIAAQKPLSFERKVAMSTELSRFTGREVDIIDLQAISGTILQQALCSGVIIKQAPLVYASLIKKMWFNQADMMPYTRMVLEKHCRRFVDE